MWVINIHNWESEDKTCFLDDSFGLINPLIVFIFLLLFYFYFSLPVNEHARSDDLKGIVCFCNESNDDWLINDWVKYKVERKE